MQTNLHVELADILERMTSINEQKLKIEAEIHKLEHMGGSVAGKAAKYRDSTFARFPIVFVFLSTFGLVATLYGFEKVIDGIPFFSEHPLTVLVAGIITLAITGTLYKKLA
jgi:hypothetical protein